MSCCCGGGNSRGTGTSSRPGPGAGANTALTQPVVRVTEEPGASQTASSHSPVWIPRNVFPAVASGGSSRPEEAIFDPKTFAGSGSSGQQSRPAASLPPQASVSSAASTAIMPNQAPPKPSSQPGPVTLGRSKIP